MLEKLPLKYVIRNLNGRIPSSQYLGGTALNDLIFMECDDVITILGRTGSSFVCHENPVSYIRPFYQPAFWFFN